MALTHDEVEFERVQQRVERAFDELNAAIAAAYTVPDMIVHYKLRTRLPLQIKYQIARVMAGTLDTKWDESENPTSSPAFMRDDDADERTMWTMVADTKIEPPPPSKTEGAS